MTTRLHGCQSDKTVNAMNLAYDADWRATATDEPLRVKFDSRHFL